MNVFCAIQICNNSGISSSGLSFVDFTSEKTSRATKDFLENKFSCGIPIDCVNKSYLFFALYADVYST